MDFGSTDFWAELMYNLLLYSMLGMTGLPVLFSFSWGFFDFFHKHKWAFYVLFFVLFFGAVVFFYFLRAGWILWYYAFPAWAQVAGLLLVIVTGLVVSVAQRIITIRVRFFYPLLKKEQIELQTEGVYKYVRHPMYAILPWMVLGALLYTGQFVLLFPLFLNLCTRSDYAAAEERLLAAGPLAGDYEKYKKQTPNMFWPHFGKRK